MPSFWSNDNIRWKLTDFSIVLTGRLVAINSFAQQFVTLLETKFGWVGLLFIMIIISVSTLCIISWVWFHNCIIQ